MYATYTIEMDIYQKPRDIPIVVSEGDLYSRRLKYLLKAQNVPYAPPEDAVVLVRYQKSDGKEGMYDTLPDGTPAGSVSGNEVMVYLAPQVCNVKGKVNVYVTLVQETARLRLFGILLDVADVPADAPASAGYINVSALVGLPEAAAVGQVLVVAEVDEGGNVTALAAEEKAQPIKNHGDLLQRDQPEQHPISAITGLEELLAEKMEAAQVEQMVDDRVALADGDTFVIHAAADGEPNDEGMVTLTMDQTGAQIIAAFEAGKDISMLINGSGLEFDYQLRLNTVQHIEDMDPPYTLIFTSECMDIERGTISGYHAAVVGIYSGGESITAFFAPNGFTVASGGGASIFTIPVTYDRDSEECETAVTYAEVIAAHAAGKYLLMDVDEDGYHTILPLSTITSDNLYFTVVDINLLSCCAGITEGENGACDVWFDDTLVVATTEDLQSSLPTVTAENNGAFLRVVDGAWAAAMISNGEEATF